MAKNYVNAGTASVDNGGTTVTFDGVSLTLMKAGDQFMQGGFSGILLSVDADAGTAELVDVWGGPDSTDAAYAVMTIPVGAELANSTRNLQTALTGLALASFLTLTPALGETIVWNDDGSGWNASSASDFLGPINATDNPISNITTAMFAANVVDTDATFAANSNTRLVPQATIKAYVDNAVAVAITGLSWKAPVKVRTTGNVTLSGEQTIDGVLTSGSRVLVMAQTTGSQNGIYITGAGAWTRAADGDSGVELVAATVPVTSGSLYADTAWYVTNDAITLGSTAIVFQQVPMATYTAGAGLSLTGTQFSISGTQALTTLTLGGASIGSDALAITGSMSISGNINAAGGMSTTGGQVNANFAAIGGQVAGGATALNLNGSTNSRYRAIFNGNTSTVQTANASYANIVIGAVPATEATSGTHPLLANLAIKAPVFTDNASAATTNTATVYIEGAPTGTVTPTGGAYALWVAGGAVRLDGALTAAGVTSSANIILSANGGEVQLRNGSTRVTSPANAQLQFGAADAASPVAQVLSMQSVAAGTSDTAGVNASLYLSRGTGTGIGGNLVIYGAPHGSTGNTQNSYVAALTLNGDTLAATFGGSVTAGTSLIAAAGSAFSFNGRAQLLSPADQTLGLTNWAASIQAFLSVLANNSLQIGRLDAASPSAQSISFQSAAAGNSNVAGANASLYLSRGTGTGVAGNLVIYGAPHGSTGNTQNSYTAALTLNGDTLAALFGGKVTIGQTSQASDPLYVHTATNFNFRAVNLNSTVTLSAVNDAGNAAVPMTYDASQHIFTGGNMMIGTTTDGGWIGAAKQSVVASQYAFSAYVTGSSGHAINARVDNAAAYLMGFNYGTSGVGNITTDTTNLIITSANSMAFHATNGAGNIAVQVAGSGGVQIGAGASAWSAICDYRAKILRGLYSGAGVMVDAVPVYLAAMKENPMVFKAMFLAHEVQARMPYAVWGEKDGETMQRLESTDPLVPVLWAALQETRAELATLKTMLAA